MKKQKEQIDKLIKESLNEEEAKFYDALDEQDLLEMIGGVFKGKMRWLAILMNIVNLVVFGILIYCIVQFMKVEVVIDLIRWGIAIAACFMTLSMIKLYMWMQINKNALLRELKRLELQIAVLSAKMKEY